MRILRELSDRGSVTAVARALRVTPSAISQHLAALQRDFAVPLTHRRGRVLELTAAGVALAETAVSIESLLLEARIGIEKFQDGAGSPVSLSAFHSAGLSFFVPLVRKVREREGAELRLADEDVSQSEFPELTADYDLVLAHRLVHGTPWPTRRVAVVPLLTEPLDVALPTGHRLAAREVLDPVDLVAERWVTTHDGFPPAAALDMIAAAAGRPIDASHRINDYSTTRALVAAGDAIALMPRYMARVVGDKGVVLRPLAGLRMVRSVDVLTRPENLMRPSVRLVLDALIAIAGELQER